MLFFYFTGTHDIQNISYDQQQNDLCVIYLQNSSAMGALLHFQSEDNNHYFLYLDRAISQNYTLKQSMNNIFLTAFDVRSNGLLQDGYVYPAVDPIVVSHMEPNISKYNIDINNVDILLVFVGVNRSISKCWNNNNEEVTIDSFCLCSRFAISDIYQFIIINSNEKSGKINVSTRNCSASFKFKIIYNSEYYVAIYVSNKNKTLIFIPTEKISIEKPSNKGNGNLIFLIGYSRLVVS